MLLVGKVLCACKMHYLRGIVRNVHKMVSVVYMSVYSCNKTMHATPAKASDVPTFYYLNFFLKYMYVYITTFTYGKM